MVRLLILSGILAAGTTAAEPKVPARPRVVLPTNNATLEEVQQAFRAAGYELTTQGNWEANRRYVFPASAPPLNYIAAINEVAQLMHARIVVTNQDQEFRLIPLEPGQPLLSYAFGDFRTVVQSIVAKRDFTANINFIELTLYCHWDPSLCVVRSASAPTLETISLDHGTTSHTAPRSSAPVRDASHTMTIRLPHVPREATKLHLTGKYRLTLAESLQSIVFTDLAALKPQTKSGPWDEDVLVTLQPPRTIADRVEFMIELVYPKSDVIFESYESALRFSKNQAMLIGPQGEQILPSNDEIRLQGDITNLVYRFDRAKVANLAAGWRLELKTPTRFREQEIPFDLPGIPLP